MSFILEALKKSEQQRQQQATPAKNVKKRTLSLQATPSGRRLPWLLVGLLPLILLCGWWYYAQTEDSQTAPPADAQSTNPVSPQTLSTADTAVKATPTKILQQELEEAAPVLQSTSPKETIPVEPSPVPRGLGSPRTTETTPLQGKNFSTADRKIQAIDAPVETLVISQPEPLAEDELYPSSRRLPLYAELSGDLRGRMPAINMSMHFYNKEPNRRLVRINDLLLHEGDWVAGDLQLAEITVDGVTLDFLGKTFTLPRNRR